MSLLGKLMFWKREEEPMPDFGKAPDFGSNLGMDLQGGDKWGMPESGGNDLGLPPNLGNAPELPTAPSLQAPRLEEAYPGQQQRGARQQQQPYQQQYHSEQSSNRDFEIISLKIDAIKSTLEVINERLARLEKIAEGGSESHRF